MFKMMAMDPAVKRCRLLVNLFFSKLSQRKWGACPETVSKICLFLGKMNSNGISSKVLIKSEGVLK